ncbi:MAG: histidine triad nucleotide-binding protein [Gemmatimonadota bacterium]|jgi:histidine triad (HIT) family protein
MTDCIFCRIAEGAIPSTIVHADEEFVAFRDINPVASTHVLVIPRRHIGSANQLGADDAALVGRLLLVGRSIAATEGIAEPGYRFVINTGEDGGQSVAHLHLHVIGGRAMGWPPG